MFLGKYYLRDQPLENYNMTFIPNALKARVYDQYVLLVLTFGRETWTIKK